MPSVNSGRVKITGRGEIEYTEDTANATSSSSSNSESSSAPAADAPVLSVVGQNIGNGHGLYAGANGSDHTVLEFKTLLPGPGIKLESTANGVRVSLNGEITGNGVVVPGATDGFKLALGSIEQDGDGSWTPGAVPLTNSTTVSEAVDRLNEMLGLLIPAGPPNFPNGTLTISNAAGSNPRLALGVTDHTGGGAPAAGSAVTRIATSTASTNTLNDVGPPTGTLQLLVNGAFAATRTLTGTDAGTYNGLVISDQKDYPVSQPGFWKSFDVAASGVPVTTGVNKIRINHTEASPTNEAFFVRDDMTSTPTLSGTTLTLSSLGAATFSSGIPHFTTGGVVLLGGQMNNLAGETYYGGNDPLVVSGTNSIITAQTYDYQSLGITTPIPRQTVAMQNFTPVLVNIDGTTHGVGTLQAVVRNVNGASGSTQVSSTKILVKRGTAGTGKVDELSVPVNGLGSLPNANFAVRVAVGANGDTPSGTPTAWVANAALANYEAAVVGGRLENCQTDFSSGYLPVGLNYSQGRNNPQYVTFSFNRASVSTFKINITGTYADVWVKLPGISDNSTISPNSVNGWWVASKAYGGAGVPGNASDLLAGCAVGGVANGNSGSFTITFGPQSSTNAVGNQIIVRIRLNAGQAITGLSFSN